MLRVRRATERFRGGEPAAGITSLHAFSFAGFYDPGHVRFGPLTACNEEHLAPGAGFGAHPHRDVEIVTWVIEGELTHEDSAGNATVVRPGDVQRLTAGGGVRHAERNAGAVPLRFLQMWLIPGEAGGEPEYDVVRGIADATPYALPRTGAVLQVLRLPGGARGAVPPAPRAYVHVVRGGARLTAADGDGDGDAALLAAGDAALLTGADGSGRAQVRAEGAAELLVWELRDASAPDRSGAEAS